MKFTSQAKSHALLISSLGVLYLALLFAYNGYSIGILWAANHPGMVAFHIILLPWVVLILHTDYSERPQAYTLARSKILIPCLAGLISISLALKDAVDSVSTTRIVVPYDFAEPRRSLATAIDQQFRVVDPSSTFPPLDAEISKWQVNRNSLLPLMQAALQGCPELLRMLEVAMPNANTLPSFAADKEHLPSEQRRSAYMTLLQRDGPMSDNGPSWSGGSFATSLGRICAHESLIGWYGKTLVAVAAFYALLSFWRLTRSFVDTAVSNFKNRPVHPNVFSRFMFPIISAWLLWIPLRVYSEIWIPYSVRPHVSAFNYIWPCAAFLFVALAYLVKDHKLGADDPSPAGRLLLVLVAIALWAGLTWTSLPSMLAGTNPTMLFLSEIAFMVSFSFISMALGMTVEQKQTLPSPGGA